MRGCSFKRYLYGVSFICGMMFVASNAFSQVYYPMDVQITNPNGKLETYTMYVPGEVQAGMAYQQQQVAVTNPQGQTEYQIIYVPAMQQSIKALPDGSYELSSNPWAETSGANQSVAVASAPVATSALRTSGTSSVSTLANSNVNASSAPSSRNGNENLRDLPLPTWVGQNTTYNTAMGQEMIAPEINKTNMLSMVEHLRKLGYIVPDSLDTAIATAPSKTKVAMIDAVNWVQGGGNSNSSPMLKSIAKISKDLEENYGFSFENILGTSLNILDAR